MITLREEQRRTVDAGLEILRRYNLLYLAAQVRTGKTLMSLTIAKEIGWQRLCFISTKKALSSIQSDYHQLGHQFRKITIINYDQAHNLSPEYDGYILDEATRLAAFPKPTKIAKTIYALTYKKKSPIILMSGTPTPESPSQIFHQYWVSYFSPFSVYANFYKWAKDYVKQYDVKNAKGQVIKTQVKQKWIRGMAINDYSEGIEEKIKEVTKHYTVTLSQKEAGFTSDVQEEILWVDIDPRMYKLMKILKKDKVYKFKQNNDWIVADTPVKLQSLFHQISSGTVKVDDNYYTLDESKIKFIKERFRGQKIAIFYKFIEEGNLIRRYFPLHTDSPELFNQHDNITFVCQVVSGRMGVNLSTADALVMYNIDFSATTYFQARARMQVKERKKESKLYWIFSRHGLERYVYDTVCAKKNFTLDYFKQSMRGLF